MKIYEGEVKDPGPVYLASEVDAYVDALEATIQELRAEVERQDEQLSALRPTGRATDAITRTHSDEVRGMAAQEAILGRALLAAQRAADELLRLASEEADAIVNRARTEAAVIAEQSVGDRAMAYDGPSFSASSGPRDDHAYFESLRKRVRSSEDLADPYRQT